VIELDAATISGVIEMAWDDCASFEAISRSYGLDEPAVIRLMRAHLRPGSFKVWRSRVSGRASKHEKLKAAAKLGPNARARPA
jgi:uncharacterized protein (TIGR03643 family)